MLSLILAGYPVLLSLYVFLRRKIKPEHDFYTSTEIKTDSEDIPSVSIIVPAYNEENSISHKIENCKRLKYDHRKLEIIIVSDGSTDKTEELSHASDVLLLTHSERKGKISAMNTGAKNASGDILVFSDANCILDHDAVIKLIEPFHSLKCGFSCGDLRLYTREYSSLSGGEIKYWDYERHLRRMEDHLGVVVGVVGSLFAVRRQDYPYPPEDTILDDLDIALQIASSGKSLHWVPEALAFEETAKSSICEFSRKIRLVAGGYQLMRRRFNCFSLSNPHLLVAFVFHKALRWTAPLFSLTWLYSSWKLRSKRPFGIIIIFAFISFLATIFEGLYRIFIQKKTGIRSIKIKTTGIIFYAIVIHFAAIGGLWRFLSGSQPSAWKMAQR